MPIIYDIDTLLASEISPDDSIFMLDSSDKTMSENGTNKVEISEYFSTEIPTEELFKFVDLNISSKIEGNITLEIFNILGSSINFTDDGTSSKIQSIDSGIYLTESEKTRISESIETLSFLRVSNNNTSFERSLNPVHFQNSPSSLICSNLSSLQANLIDLYYKDGKNFSEALALANSKINDFFNGSSPSTLGEFNINNLFPSDSLVDVQPTNRFQITNGEVVENINGYVNENYNYLVNVLVNGTSTSQSFVNFEIAKKIKNGSFIENFFNSADFVISFINEFNPSENAENFGVNYILFLNLDNEIKEKSTNLFDFSEVTIGADFIWTESDTEGEFFSTNVIFTEEAVFEIERTTLSDSIDSINLTVDNLSEKKLNQNYSIIGSNRSKGVYLSEDERFEIIYGLTGSSPSVDSITFDENSQEYTVNLANLDGNFSYQIEFDNIVNSVYNTSGQITGIKTDYQTLPISNKFEITPLKTGLNQSTSFKLLESKSESLNDPESSNQFNFGDIKFLRSNKNLNPYLDQDLSWIIRSSDVRKNFEASTTPSIENISGENYFKFSINNTAGLVFDILAAGFNFQYEPIETSIRGSDDTIVRRYKLSETPYNFFKISAFFSEEKDLLSHQLDAGDGISPLGLNSGWLNISGDSQFIENPIIVSSGVEYDLGFSKSGFSILFEYKNLTTGIEYYKEIPKFVEFESDPNVYLTSGNSYQFDLVIFENAISFVPQSSHHIEAVPYSISGAVYNPLVIDEPTDINFIEGQALTFEASDFRLIIPEGVTTGILAP